MRVTPARFILLRLANVTLCRFALGDRLLRGLLLRLAQGGKGGDDVYCQCADFFAFDQLGQTAPPDDRTI